MPNEHEPVRIKPKTIAIPAGEAMRELAQGNRKLAGIEERKRRRLLAADWQGLMNDTIDDAIDHYIAVREREAGK